MGQKRVRAKSFLSGQSSHWAARGAKEAEEQKRVKLAVLQGYRQDGLKTAFHFAQFIHPVHSLGTPKQFCVHSKVAGPKGVGQHPAVSLSGLPSTAYTR
jgi:hypothetical protein